MSRLMVMAGGTGGHIYPALAVAEAWQAAGGEVVWLGNPAGMEGKIVPEAGITLEPVSIAGLRGKGINSLLAAPLRLVRALVQSISAIRRQQPDVVLGMGGFASGPGGLAAWLLRKPLVIHEQNAIPGLTNKLLSRLASEVLEAFPNTFPEATTVGNPVRSDLYEIEPVAPHQPLRLLVLGGSLGAQRLNQLVPQLLQQLSGVVVWHQSGAKNLQETEEYYREAGVDLDAAEVRLAPYIKEMGAAYQWADLVLCRAGAMTVSELALAGRGSILVPFPYAVDDHQRANGAFLEAQGAAWLVPQAELSLEKVLQWIETRRQHPEQLIEMGRAAKAVAKPDATRTVVTTCQRCCR